MTVNNKCGEGMYTIEAGLESLKKGVQQGTWLEQMAHVVDGKATGEAIRTTGGDLVYVRFSDNPSGRPLSFSIPKQFLIPASCIMMRSTSEAPVTPQTAGLSAHASFAGRSGSSESLTVSPHPANTREHHEVVELGQQLGACGEPMLCVVCGRWDPGKARTEQKRKSGHKCIECVGKKSLPRLRTLFSKLEVN